MGTIHDNLANVCCDDILYKLRSGDEATKQIFSTRIVRSADWDWPRPDYVCIDEKLKCSYALEFKPPKQSKREYLTGLGQALSYLQKHMYSGLIVPTLSDDGFQIANFIADTLKADEFKKVGISLYSYNPYDVYAGVNLIHGITCKRKRGDIKEIDITNNVETFWCFWRDCSNYELYELLDLAFKYNDEEGDIYSERIYPEFYSRLMAGKTKNWEGVGREKTDSKKSKAAEKQNYKIPLTQLELWSEGHLTNLGFRMLEIGKKYGAGSEAFKNALCYLILVKGRHLELIKYFDDFNKSNKIPAKVNDYLLMVEDYLTQNGCIGSRKPTAIKTNAKATYIRDEPKLWNKFGLLERNSSMYFHKEEGYKFNWHNISDVLISGGELLNSIHN